MQGSTRLESNLQSFNRTLLVRNERSRLVPSRFKDLTGKTPYLKKTTFPFSIHDTCCRSYFYIILQIAQCQSH